MLRITKNIKSIGDQRTKICVRKTSYYQYDEIIVLKKSKDLDPDPGIPKVTDPIGSR
jgi:hypothetical protein